MPEVIKKLAGKLPCGKKCKSVILILFGLLLVLCIFAVWQILSVEQNIFTKPGVLTSYNTLKSTKDEIREEKNITLMFGGDVMLARHVQTLQERQGSYTVAWENIKNVFSEADLAIVNLESPLVSSGPYLSEGINFRAKPENIAGLLEAGIDVVQLANNHLGNAGELGMTDTFATLENANIVYIGAGTSIVAAYTGKIVEANGITVGFVGQGYNVPWYKAIHNKAGIAVFDTTELTRQIELLKKESVDIIVAMFHGGIEYVREPNADQINFAHTAIDAGADVVIGHHPHWIQNMEEYEGKYIFYSLGNLIFDQNWSTETSQGLVVKLEIATNKTIQVYLQPVIIEENFQPRWATEAEAKDILKQVNIPFDYLLFDNLL